MILGVPKETKRAEQRVALLPVGVEELVRRGHTVLVEAGAGRGSGFDDERYRAAGAEIVPRASDVWERADMIVKVKEPTPEEYGFLRRDLVIFTYFHFAADERLTRAVIESGAVAIAYETVQLPSGELPLLTPMSEVAGRMSIQAGARYLEAYAGGRGVLLSGVPGVAPATVVVLGGGVVGSNAARIAAGMGAQVRVLEISLPRLRYLAEVMPANVQLIYSHRHNILEQIAEADLLVGAVLVPGAKAPTLVRRADLAVMKRGAVIVDVAVDQGGCVETIHPTTHDDPVYEIDGILHYGVANMPGAVPRTSTLALTNATFPYVLKLAEEGWREACRRDGALRLGLNIVGGRVVYPAVAEAFGLEWTPVEEVLGTETAALA